VHTKISSLFDASPFKRCFAQVLSPPGSKASLDWSDILISHAVAGMKEAHSGIVTIDSIGCATFNALLQFLYTGKRREDSKKIIAQDVHMN